MAERDLGTFAAQAEAGYDEAMLLPRPVDVRVSPRERSVTTTRVVRDKAAVKGARPLHSQRTKKTYFLPRFVHVEARQYPDGTWVAERVTVQGWVIIKREVKVGRLGQAIFNQPDGMIYAPDWLKDHVGALMEELMKKYPASS